MRELKPPSPSELILNSVIGRLRPRAVHAETPVLPAATGALRPETPKESAELRLWLQSDPAAKVQGERSEPLDAEFAPPVGRRLTRWGAAALDAAVLIAINAGLVLLIAWGSGLAARSLVRERSIALGALCSVPTVLYFILFNGIAGQTLGGWLCRLPRPGQHEPLTLDAILRRSILK